MLRPGLPSSEVTLASCTSDHRHSPLHCTPGGRKFFPRFFIPRAAQAQGLLQACESRRGRLLPPPLPEPSPAFRVSGPRSLPSSTRPSCSRKPGAPRRILGAPARPHS